MMPKTYVYLTAEQANSIEKIKHTEPQNIPALEIPEELAALGLRNIIQLLLGGEYRILLTEQPDGQELTAVELDTITGYLSTNFSDKVGLLRTHQDLQSKTGWTNPTNEAFNNLSVEQLGKALFYGYQLIQESGNDLDDTDDTANTTTQADNDVREATNDPLAEIAAQNDETEEI